MNDDLFSKSFDHLLAFVLPGLLALWGYSFFDPAGLGSWFKSASTADTSLGGFLFLVLAALGVGVFISGLRWVVLERVLCLFPEAPPLDDAKRREPGVLEAYADARHHHFYYYLFYSNMLCAVPVVLVAWKWTSNPAPPWPVFAWALAGFVCVEAVLFFSARQAIGRFKTKAERILGVISRGEPDNAQRRLARQRR